MDARINAKRKPLLIAAVVVITVIALIAVLWFALWAPPSKDDYKASLDTLTKLDKANTTINDKFVAYNQAVNADFKADKGFKDVVSNTADKRQAYKDSLKAYQTTLADIGDSKATRNDDVKAVYDKFVQQNKKFETYIETYVDNAALYQSSLSKTDCQDIFDVIGTSLIADGIAKRHKEAATDCLPQMKALAASSNLKFAEYGKAFVDLINKRQENFDNVVSRKITEQEGSARNKEIAKKVDGLIAIDPFGSLIKTRDAAGLAGVYSELRKVIEAKEKAA